MYKPTKKFLNDTTKDSAWIRKNFTRLVDNHGGKFLIVVNQEPFIGRNSAALFKKVRAKYPNSIPTCMPIPRKKDFISILCVL